MTGARHLDNNNPRPDIEKLKRDVLENLRELAHTPSAHACLSWGSSHVTRNDAQALHPALTCTRCERERNHTACMPL